MCSLSVIRHVANVATAKINSDEITEISSIAKINQRNMAKLAPAKIGFRKKKSRENLSLRG